MNRHSLVDARLHIERKHIAKCPKPSSCQRVVPNDMQGIQKNFGPQITREKPRFGAVLHAQEFQSAIARLALGYQKNPDQRASDGQ